MKNTDDILNKTIWIAWERHRRTIELCKFITIDPLILISGLPRVLKHPYFIIKTIHLINNLRPKVVIVQNPSIVLTLLVCVLKSVFNFKLIVDTHNAAIIPENKILQLLNYFYIYFHKVADMTIVTNFELATIVKNNGGSPLILPDILPQISKINTIKLNSKYNITFICTFQEDEPFEEVFQVPQHLTKDITIYVTGNFKGKEKIVSKYTSPKLKFLGFVDDDYYWKLLVSSDIIIDLTKRDGCLVCGAYEAVAIKTPLILSDTKILRDYFYKGAVFTKNNTHDIVDNINYLIDNLENYKKDIAKLKNEINREWIKSGSRLQENISN